jgi:DNA-binding transcriptional ArsR family regulator
MPKARKKAPVLSNEMLELVAARFRVLGEPSRLKLVRTLEAGETNVTALVQQTGLTQANASRHLQTLTDAGILGRRKEGLNVIYFIADPDIFALCDLVCGGLERRHARHARVLAGGRGVK